MTATPVALPDARAVMERAGSENFPVALRVLSARERDQLLAIYGFARLVDDLGDELHGDRLAALDWLQGELVRCFRGCAEHPLLVRLQHTLAVHPLPQEPFVRLIDANRTDQRVTRYRSFDQLLSYCALSANPVGELVLAVFGLLTAERVARSDEICTALQLAEHWQDVAEDFGRGRVYIPAEDLERFDVSVDDLLAVDRAQRERVRALIQFEVARARQLLRAGEPLLDTLKGRPKLAVAGFVSGGRAALDAIEGAGFEVLDGPPRASRVRRARALAAVLVEHLR
ncbi:MAG: squalene synthase HpnC [Solirubrobacteraceae bacterium]